MKNSACCLLLFVLFFPVFQGLAGEKRTVAAVPPPVLTSLWPSFCNSALPSINTLIGITTVAGSTTAYRIRAVNGAEVQVIERGVAQFTMTQFPNYAFATTYTIQIELQRNGVWVGVYGPPCTVTTPPEVFTSLWPSFCNSVLPSINTLIGITSVAGPITAYRIRAVNGAEVQVIERGVAQFTMMNFPIYAFSTTYTIQVELQRSGVWSGLYGPPCTVTTPAGASGASVIPELCGSTLSKIKGIISTPSLQFVNGYRYRITNLTDPTGPFAVQVFNYPLNWFVLTMLNRYNYGTTYRIEVALRTFGIYGDYGPPCEVSTPPPPILTNCAATVATGIAAVSCPSLPMVYQYRFQVVRQSDLASATIDRNYPNFSFSMLPPWAFTGNEQYNVRIAVMTTATWSPFGDVCTITSPATANRMEAPVADTEDLRAIKAVAYPNPFASDFTLDLMTPSTDAVQLDIYNLMGRIVDSKTVPASEVHSIILGGDLPSGDYVVVVRMEGEVVRKRVVKN